VVGFVGGIESIDGVEAKQFKKTLDEIDPDIKVLVHWVGSWSDIKLAQSSANKQIKQDADVLVADANIGIILAAKKTVIYPTHLKMRNSWRRLFLATSLYQVLHSPLKGGIEEMPLGIFSMGVNIQISYPHRLKMDLIS